MRRYFLSFSGECPAVHSVVMVAIG